MITTMFLFNLIVFNIIVDGYFYFQVVRKLTPNRFLRSLHWVIDLVFVLTTFVLFYITRTEDGISHVIRQGFIFLYLLVYLPKAVYMVCSLPALLFRRRIAPRRFFQSLGAVSGSLLFVLMVYGNLVGQYRLRVSEVEIRSDKLPEAFDGYRVVQIADLHVGNMRGTRLTRRLGERIEELRPDLLLFCGDLVHSRTSEIYPYTDILARYRAPDGVFAVMGNHDYGDYAWWPDSAAYRKNLSDLQDFYRDIDWRLLDNESVYIRRGADSIALLGVENWGEPPFPQYGKLALALRGTKPSDYKILMTHNPNHWLWEVRESTDIDLSLSGHTHAMQTAVRIGKWRWSPSAWRYKLWGGLYHEGDQYIYVNEGIGAVLIPFRLGATPEITVLTLRKK